MGLHWSWAFGNESTTDLSAMGWTTGGVNQTLTSSADQVYTYTGSPARYGWILKGNYGYFVLPPAATAGLASGWLAAPFKSLVGSGYYNNQVVLRVYDTTGTFGIYALLTTAGAMSLYVGNAFKETTAVIDWTSWRYVALKWDFSANPWAGQLYVDGVSVTSAYTQARAASTADDAQVGPGPGRFNVADVLCSQIIVWGLASDAGETPYFATRCEPTSDGTNVGTWTPSTGADDYAVVASPFSTSTYTQDGTPSASDRCEVVTSTLATALGVTPSSIIGATAHTFSEGQSVTARAIVGPSGGAETAGTTTAISAGSTSYAFATSTAALTGSSTLDVVYEVVSV